MAVRRISRASKRRLTIFGTLSLAAIVYCIFSLFYNVYTIYELTVEKNKLDDEYIQLKEEAEELKIDIEKLSDEKYLANFARETYYYSKDGEYILQINDEDVQNLSKKIKDTNEGLEIINLKLSRNYILFCSSAILILILVYIIVKGKNRKKK